MANLEERLGSISCGAYGVTKTVCELLDIMSDDDLRDVFDKVLATVLQEERNDE